MTVFERIKSMTEEELGQFILTIYKWGHTNERCDLNDEPYYKHLMTYDHNVIDDIVRDYDEYGKNPYKIKVANPDGSDARYIRTQFYTIADATDYIRTKCRFRDDNGYLHTAVRVNQSMYTHGTKVLTIERSNL